MKKIGLKHPVYAIYSDTTGSASYTNGVIMGKAITAKIKWDKNDAKLFADDALDETDQSLTGGTETLELNELTHEVQSTILGHLINGSGELVANENDTAPYVGHGFYGKVKRNNVNKWRAVWFHKMQYGEPEDDNATQGEKITFQTPSVEGKIMKDVNGNFKSEKIFDTESAAIAWLDGKAGITPQCSTPVANLETGTYALAQTVTLSAGAGESIYYTTNGLTPSATVGTLYSVPINIAASTLLKAVAIKEGSSNSEIAEYEYTITA